MTFKISEFSARLNKNNGLAKTNLFVVRITPPSGLILGQMPTEDMVFFCRSVDIPGININTTDIFNQGHGQLERRASGVTFDPLNAIFMVDGNFGIKRFFHRWAQLVVNYNVDNHFALDQGKLPYEVGYKDEYTGTIDITIFSPNNDTSYSYNFRNVYPTSVGNVTAAWENNDEIMTLPITFQYDNYHTTGTMPGVTDTILSRTNGLLSYLSALNTYGIDVDNINSIRSLQDLNDKLANVYRLFD